MERCIVCDKPLTGKRAGSKTCSTKCRKAKAKLGNDALIAKYVPPTVTKTNIAENAMKLFSFSDCAQVLNAPGMRIVKSGSKCQGCGAGLVTNQKISGHTHSGPGTECQGWCMKCGHKQYKGVKYVKPKEPLFPFIEQEIL